MDSFEVVGANVWEMTAAVGAATEALGAATQPAGIIPYASPLEMSAPGDGLPRPGSAFLATEPHARPCRCINDIYIANRRFVLSKLRRSHVDPGVAEDMLQEVFLKLDKLIHESEPLRAAVEQALRAGWIAVGLGATARAHAACAGLPAMGVCPQPAPTGDRGGNAHTRNKAGPGRRPALEVPDRRRGWVATVSLEGPERRRSMTRARRGSGPGGDACLLYTSPSPRDS